MKPYITPLLLGLSLCPAVLGGPSPIYQNDQLLTTPPVVDAVIFVNAGEFYCETGDNAANGENIPYMTLDTRYYTNTSTGYMYGEPGFRFDTGTKTSRHSASVFYNAGLVEGIDVAVSPYLWAPPGSTTVAIPVPSLSQPLASQILVQATNLTNMGFYPQGIYVGDCGSLTLVGSNVSTAYGTLAAGEVDSSGLTDQNTTGLMGQSVVVGANKLDYYVASPGVNDLFWGATNTQTIQVDGFGASFLPTTTIAVTNRGGAITLDHLPLTLNPVWSYNVYSNLAPDGTNIYYNVVIVNSNFTSGGNLSAAVGFAVPANSTGPLLQPNAIVQFSEPVYDVVTGVTVFNSVYLLDSGSSLATNGMANNAGSASAYGRPIALAMTTVTPNGWLGAFPGNVSYDPTVFYVPNEFTTNKPAYVVSEYAAQIGRNPALLSGSFSPALNLVLPVVNLQDPSNEPGRIEIDAANVDLTQARLRAEGMVLLNISNSLSGNASATVDWGDMDATLTDRSGSLVVSSVVPSTFQRVRGNIYAWEATWQNIQTNAAGGDTNFPATNIFHYHVLVVDQSLTGVLQPTVRNLTLTGSNSVVVQDNLNVINQGLFNTTNLTINSSVGLSQNAQNFFPTNIPWLENLFINTNGVLGVENTLDVGYNVNQGQSAPAGRQYTIDSITNFGGMFASNGACLLQSSNFENGGVVVSYGSMVIEANELGMGLAQFESTNLLGLDILEYVVLTSGDLNLLDNNLFLNAVEATNSIINALISYGNINLSAKSIGVTNSIIYAGWHGSQGALVLEATEQLTDFVSGTPTPNTNGVINNLWFVTQGFSMPVKPATGDLYGTEIHTIATGLQQVDHVWAGTDMGSNLTGGTLNDEVIGHLVLDRSANAILRFSAAGTKNAMYVDYLELTNYAFTNYHTGLSIDPNFTIYFANCNIDPEKLMQVYYPRMIWMTNFVGPNSAQVVPYLNSTNVCLLNAGVVNSTEISFFPASGYANAYNPYYPDVLNDPSDTNIFLPCPTPPVDPVAPVSNAVEISVNGNGDVSSVVKPANMVLGKSYTVTAVPASGWVFANWSVMGLAGTVNTNSPVLPFAFVTNTVITANFVSNPFGGLRGVYNGLFSVSNVASAGSSGAFTLTLQSSGSFSGRLLMGPATYYFSSKFTGDGVAQAKAASGAHTLEVNMQLDVTGQSGQIQGDINGGAWDASLSADVAPVWTVKNPSPLAGTAYTMVLPWDSGTLDVPGGDSYGTGSVSQQGVLTVAGTLADGVTFSASAPVSQSSRWPFYAYAAAGKDSVLGWVQVLDGLSSTNVAWSKAAGKGPLYPAGFNNVLQLAGSPWRAPAKGVPALNLASPEVILSGCTMAEPCTNAVTLSNFLTYTASNLTLSIKPAGTFSGSFELPGSASKETISGVVLQNFGVARGFFPGTNDSGTVLLESK